MVFDRPWSGDFVLFCTLIGLCTLSVRYILEPLAEIDGDEIDAFVRGGTVDFGAGILMDRTGEDVMVVPRQGRKDVEYGF